ncbi:MAG TPA: PmoA family protein [Pirellulales bacterium]|jgi:hypothetical protein
MPLCRPLFVIATLLIATTSLVASAFAGDIAVEKFDGGVHVTLDGKPFTDYLIHNGPKPILWPIIGPGGHEMTRNYPMKMVQTEKRDHPHHRSLWFTHGSVNGIDFWSETPATGKQIHRDFLKCEAADGKATISTSNDWVSYDGKKQLEDIRTVTLSGDADRRVIDFDITLKASEGPVRFGDTKEGTMGLRVPTALDARQLGTRGEIVNSEGIKDAKTWGKQAPWVDYHGVIDGDPVGIAILNHPSSFRFPTYWHVRDYGLFAANPFGLHDFHGSKDEKEGEFTLPQGESITLRYRFLFHRGNESDGGVAKAFEAYSQEARP